MYNPHLCTSCVNMLTTVMAHTTTKLGATVHRLSSIYRCWVATAHCAPGSRCTKPILDDPWYQVLSTDCYVRRELKVRNVVVKYPQKNERYVWRSRVVTRCTVLKYIGNHARLLENADSCNFRFGNICKYHTARLASMWGYTCLKITCRIQI